MSIDPKLAPCPLCNAEMAYTNDYDGDALVSHPEETDCALDGFSFYVSLVPAWNRRTPNGGANGDAGEAENWRRVAERLEAEKTAAEAILAEAVRERDEAREYGAQARIRENECADSVIHWKDLATALRLRLDAVEGALREWLSAASVDKSIVRNPAFESDDLGWLIDRARTLLSPDTEGQ